MTVRVFHEVPLLSLPLGGPIYLQTQAETLHPNLSLRMPSKFLLYFHQLCPNQSSQQQKPDLLFADSNDAKVTFSYLRLQLPTH